MKKFNLFDIIEKLQDKMSSYSIDFVNDYSQSSGYICDLFSEFADGSISIYTRDQEEYYYNNQEECDDACAELCILDGFNPRKDSIGDLIARAGCAGWFMHIERDLYNYEEGIILCLAYKTLIDNDYIFLTYEELEKIENIAKQHTSNDRISDLENAILEAMKERSQEQ